MIIPTPLEASAIALAIREAIVGKSQVKVETCWNNYLAQRSNMNKTPTGLQAVDGASVDTTKL